MIGKRAQRLVFFGLISLGVHMGVWGQPYSAGFSDDENAFDAPIPGFVGPLGDGVVPAAGSEDEAFENSVNGLFLGWADEVDSYWPVYPTVDPVWRFPTLALGPVTGDAYDVVSLGDMEDIDFEDGVDPGELTLSFSEPIQNLSGADFAVFENALVAWTVNDDGVAKVFGELAFVEVSSDGTNFVRFPSVSTTESFVSSYGEIDPTLVHNLVGKHLNGYQRSWGTPFDLSDLLGEAEVVNGLVDLDQIRYVKIVDIPGRGDFTDSLGNPIYDPWSTYGSGGVDIEAVGVISRGMTFDQWAQAGVTDPDVDGDKDGYPNWMEYAFRLDPSVADRESAYWLESDEGDQMKLWFRRDERIADLLYVVEVTDDLVDVESWDAIATFGPLNQQAVVAPEEVEGVEVNWAGDQASVGVLQEVAVLLPFLVDGPRFYRIRLEPLE
tara:strand:+ start:2781 stop:4094 length:1314 start_codon:yes stop_codon:yes gene_type:complete